MIRERVADNVYVFTSDLYAQVNAGAIIGPEWAVVVDTLAYPEESQEIKEFIEDRLAVPIRYLINTHYHTDHTAGNHIFKDATILSSAKTRRLLDTQGRAALEVAKEQNRELREIQIRLPDLTYQEGQLHLRVGRRTLELVSLPGHSPDGIGVLLVEDRVLFSGDIMMPIPYLLDGNFDLLIESMKRIPKLKLENLVQGHGETILRGEIQHAVRSNTNYLTTLRRHVRTASRRRDPAAYLASIDIEVCGKSRILLSGLAEQLHQRNLTSLYQRWYGDGEQD